jgi:hypothetical protein
MTDLATHAPLHRIEKLRLTSVTLRRDPSTRRLVLDVPKKGRLILSSLAAFARGLPAAERKRLATTTTNADVRAALGA